MIKKDYLKKLAREYYYKASNNVGDAGALLSDYLSSNNKEYQQKFDEIMEELSKIDKNCPKFRFKSQ